MKSTFTHSMLTWRDSLSMLEEVPCYYVTEASYVMLLSKSVQILALKIINVALHIIFFTVIQESLEKTGRNLKLKVVTGYPCFLGHPIL